MPNTISAVTPTGTSASTLKSAAAKSSKVDQDVFLKLLVAQLKYQDVSKPMDPTQMMSQMAQLTSVDKLTALVDGQKAASVSSQLSLAANLVGRKVTWNDASGAHTEAVSEVRISGDDLFLKVGPSEINATIITSIQNT